MVLADPRVKTCFWKEADVDLLVISGVGVGIFSILFKRWVRVSRLD